MTTIDNIMALVDEYASQWANGYEYPKQLREALTEALAAQPVREPLSDEQIETLRDKTFSINNPFCPVDSKSMRKAVRAAELAHGIGGDK